jgi:hypothetical protein
VAVLIAGQERQESRRQMHNRLKAIPGTGKTVMAVLACLAAACLIDPDAHAELQSLQVGGEIIIYGELTRNLGASGSGLRFPVPWLTGRPIGAGPGNQDGLISWAAWDRDAEDYARISQWTRIHVRAGFTDEITAFIEFDHLEDWGESFRSEYVGGVDRRAAGNANVNLYQGYIEIANLFQSPLELRIGRQELHFGNEWLVGNNTIGPSPDYGLSFDAIRASYALDRWRFDAFAAKLAERYTGFGNEDTDFYGIYAVYTSQRDHEIDAYWFYLRDDESLEDIQSGALGEWVQRRSGVDQYGTTGLHTLGIRFSGAFGNFDYDLEAAYQLGDAGQAGALFQPALYGDNNAKFDSWGLNSEIGYTLDRAAWQPRFFLAYAYLGGEDKRDISFGQWIDYLINPFYTAPASVSFNRLFSNITYSYLLDGTDLSNAHILSAGASVSPNEKIEMGAWLTYLRTVAPFQNPVLPYFTFRSQKNDPELGWQIDLYAAYQYTEDLSLEVGATHLFTGKGLRQGHFNNSNGLEFNAGTARKNASYAYFELILSF